MHLKKSKVMYYAKNQKKKEIDLNKYLQNTLINKQKFQFA